MDKQEAIERLKQNKAAAEFYAGMVQNTNAIENELKDIEAMNMAIEALSAESVDVVRCKDCLYKQYDATHNFCEINYHKCYDDDFCSWGGNAKVVMLNDKARSNKIALR